MSHITYHIGLVFGAVAVTAYVGPAAAGRGFAEVKVSVSCACHIG